MRHYLGNSAKLFAVLGALLAVAAGTGAFASAAGTSGQTFTVREKVKSFQLVDVGGPGISPGDEAIYRLRVNALDGTRLGVNNAVCTVLTPVGANLAHCVGTARLPGGTIEWAGVLRLDRLHSNFAVTGGTGAYRAAAGQVFTHWTNPPTNTRALVTVQLAG